MTHKQPASGFHTTVVIPVYFNEHSVEGVVHSLLSAWQAAGFTAETLEFVLVDDASGDRSWEVLQRIQAALPTQVTCLRLVRNHGSQLAILAGASIAKGRYVAAVAADAQEPPDLVPQMARLAEAGSRVVLAVRRSRADTITSRTSASFFYRLIHLLGLREMPREGFDVFLLADDIMRMIIEMRDPNIPLAVTIAWLGFPYAEVSYDRLERTQGKSRWTLRKKIKLTIDAVTAVSYAPIRLMSLFGVCLALVGFLYAIVAIVSRLLGGVPVEGWTTLMVVTLVLGGTQLICLGVIGEYLWRTLEVTRRRPLWRVAEMRPRDGLLSAAAKDG